MATVAIGDIHGNLGPLEDLLSRVAPELQPDDTLVFLGDYIDRGPDSRECVEIIRLRAEARFKVITLMGNHEQWMMRSLDDPTRHSWLVGMESLETVKSYSEDAAETLTKAMGELGARLFFEKSLYLMTRSSMRCRPSTCGSSRNLCLATSCGTYSAFMQART